MNVDHYKTILQNKEEELTEEMSRRRENALDAKTADVEDQIDAVVTATGQDAALQEGEMAYNTLTLVRDALRRIDEGTYGTCIDCGNPIEQARLDAVPWTPYCLADQEKRDKLAAENPPENLGDLA